MIVSLYNSMKLLVQGKGTEDFVEFILEPEALLEARRENTRLSDPTRMAPRIGIDESGKGDFFGPMCVAGVYLPSTAVEALEASGVQDSKRIKSDARIRKVSDAIRKTPDVLVNVVAIGPEAYNRLYSKMRTVNRLLAWGHARCIENLLGRASEMSEPVSMAIVDQFASSESTVKNAMLAVGRDLQLVQKHKAESDLAVAAASILARESFINRLDALSQDFGMTLPKGASSIVDRAGKEFVSRHGAEALTQVAKMHFRTSYRVRGLPEPAKKTVWSRKK